VFLGFATVSVKSLPTDSAILTPGATKEALLDIQSSWT
jgi:hypothetical protein